ncbi:MAG: O-antigen ligase family protein [Solirubrobacteraceae bacterium]
MVLLALLRPVLAVSLAAGLAILCEGEAFGLFTFTAHLYQPFYKRLTPLDALVVLAAASVALDMLRDGRQLRYPRELRFPHIILVLGMVCGIAMGKAAGVGLKSLILAENLIAYLLILPITVANLKVDPRRLRLLLGGLFALALLKALLGLAEVASGKGFTVEGSANLTYYEPTANWVVMIALLGIAAALLARLRPPLWMVAGTPLLVASLVLSYRRSFWIATVLGLALVVLLALSPVGRRLLVPTALLLAAGIWLLGSVNFQSQSPIVKRAVSLAPSNLTTNVEDRYRLDERANVLAELERHPITGLGIQVPWHATTRPLPVEHEDAREYVHFAMLWWWMKLGILGLLSYLLILIATARLAWRVWRRSQLAIARAFGLASLCGVAGLLVAETTATFTGSELRFTVVLGTQIGLLALLAAETGPRRRTPEEEPDPAAA